MRRYIRNIGFIIGICSLVLVGCEDKIDPIVEKLDFSRVFTPLNLNSKIRNMTTAELNWDVRSDADSYVLEISEDSLAFSKIIKTLNVKPDELPYSVLLDGQTRYSARVKGVSQKGLADSKWIQITFKTDAENIFLPLPGENIKATSVTLNWPAGSEVTNFIINPGNTSRAITAAEKAEGKAVVTGLTGETKYTVVMYKESKQRGSVTFTTLIDLGNATPVYPTDNLSTVIAAAKEGDALVLFPGDYMVHTGVITLNKSISIKGLYPFNKPIVHVQFELENGVKNVEIRDLEMDGLFIDPATTTETILSHAFAYNTSGVSYGTLDVVNCNIHDYDKSIFSGSSSVVSTIQSISMNGCVVTNVLTNSADCIDFRGGYVGSLSLKNSTFVNCAPARDFIRLDDTSGTYPGKVSNVIIDRCTMYGVANNASRRILYVRFVDNTLKVTNTIIAETVGNYTNQSRSAQPECSNNNYFNAPAFVPGGSELAGVKFDISGNHSVLNPGFKDAAKGDFTISNQSLKDKNTGDPRWN